MVNSSSHWLPELCVPRIHTWYWLAVSATGYGSLTIKCWMESHISTENHKNAMGTATAIVCKKLKNLGLLSTFNAWKLSYWHCYNATNIYNAGLLNAEHLTDLWQVQSKIKTYFSEFSQFEKNCSCFNPAVKEWNLSIVKNISQIVRLGRYQFHILKNTIQCLHEETKQGPK